MKDLKPLTAALRAVDEEMTMETKALVTTRRSVHGDWHHQAACADELQTVAAKYGLDGMTPQQRQAINHILVKISRAICGDSNHADHWDDIGGYALLGKGGHPDR